MMKPPFVLLDDARANGAPARLYRNPVRIVAAASAEDVRPALAAIRAAMADGLHVAGMLAYEAGAALVPGIAARDTVGPMLWFGLFEGFEPVADVAAMLPDPAGAFAAAPVPRIDREAYDAAFARVAEWIRAGDIYQANLSLRADVRVQGDPLALYARLRRAAGAGYGAVVATGEAVHLSLSPELFFALDGDRLTCRPMKGTAPRSSAADEDRAAMASLADDPKQRAENLMIVDLKRNDLSRVAVPGSVEVPALFEVESFPTVHQMTSTVTARLQPGRDAIDVVEALFPSGSITGAPKRRAMEVIAAVEPEPRGLYTGAIGRIEPGGDAMFNVAIRTLTLADGADTAVLGLGSGVVADSRVDEEWAECLAKGAFITAGVRQPDLIETMAFDPDTGLTLIERHLARMKASALALGYTFDRHAARNELQAATFRLRTPRKVRLLLGAGGQFAIVVAPLPPALPVPARVAAVPLPVDPSDVRLRHKTSDRGFYDEARRTAGTDEVAFVGPDGLLTEGSFTSIFVERDGILVTPPLARGLLPGILREQLIDEGRAIEGDLTAADLGDGFLIGNALRGLVPAVVAVAKGSHPPL
ncbi:para-aminobenzoate synthetase/4-amino-4-deoxychorismate lyase [Sphingomonas jinjuensis]|uniref:Probable branched-chain-amino-acid aminotransferase n=2 Tax=Sphingomonas jinjuensis TaxID=535907 RepID=A0A840F8K0_9SPHN|nr:para-aminobenzoate synthetase/4-amino-4-deoxychorismate lyase [Sphingomonas jinjuensis]